PCSGELTADILLHFDEEHEPGTHRCAGTLRLRAYGESLGDCSDGSAVVMDDGVGQAATVRTEGDCGVVADPFAGGVPEELCRQLHIGKNHFAGFRADSHPIGDVEEPDEPCGVADRLIGDQWVRSADPCLGTAGALLRPSALNGRDETAGPDSGRIPG